MDSPATIKKRIITLLAIIVLAGVGVAVYFITNRFDGSGNWPVLSPDRITLIDVEGKRVSVSGDYRMDQTGISTFTQWLESNGLRQDQGEEKYGNSVSFRGEYKGSLPITVTIETPENPETAKIFLSYEGSDQKQRFNARKRLVQVFSNEVIKQCTEKVF